MGRKLPDDHQLILNAFDSCFLPTMAVDEDVNVLYRNNALNNLLGYTGEKVGNEVDELFISDITQLKRRLALVNNTELGLPLKFELSLSHRSGTELKANFSIVKRLEGPVFTTIVGHIEDPKFTRVEAEFFMPDSLFYCSGDAIYIVDPKTGMFVNSNKIGYERLGYTFDELMSLTVMDINPEVNDKSEWHLLSKKIIGESNCLFESTHEKKDKTKFAVELNVTYVNYLNQHYFVTVARDISLRKEQEVNMWRQANLDPLTGLLNRRILLLDLKALEMSSLGKRSKIALIFIDLDDFKELNDTFGHAYGDAVLKAVAGRLKHNVRKNKDLVARLGGDEFLIAVPFVSDIKQVQVLVKKIERVFIKPFRIEEKLVAVNASIGVRIVETQPVDFDKEISRADKAMYQAKTEQGVSVHFHY